MIYNLKGEYLISINLYYFNSFFYTRFILRTSHIIQQKTESLVDDGQFYEYFNPIQAGGSQKGPDTGVKFQGHT